MKKILQFSFVLMFFGWGFSQQLKPIAEKVRHTKADKKTFVKYNLFSEDLAATKRSKYQKAAEGITVMKLDRAEIQRITSEKPEAIEISFPFDGKTIALELVKNKFFTQDFKVNTDKGYVNYDAGAYYQGIVKGDDESIVAISFFKDDVVGVSSIKNIGNIVIGKTKDSGDYVSYNDQNLKGENPFSCSADELPENKASQISFDPNTVSSKATANCVRIYYEAGYGPYTQNGSNVTTTVNWVTAMHNNISTLYANDGITVSLSEVFVWTSTDPFTGTPSQILNKFRNYRTSFNGDVAQLLRNPATTSIAWVNALCSTYKYSYSGVNFAYSDVPTYSWNIEAMTHEIGHNLGSPHTHACAWNGNNTAIDGCGPASGNNEGCNAALPTNGGTIMSYCHLVSSVGINFANGFGVQPGALIRNTVNSKGCLGTNCVNSCSSTITGLEMTNIGRTSATVTIVDNAGTNWKYRVKKNDGTILTSGTTTNKAITINGLQANSYYKIQLGTDCSGPDAFAYEQTILTDALWCSGAVFTDTGGVSGNYGDTETIVKTFYPSSSGAKLKMTFTEFETEDGYDFMDVYNGPSTSSPLFANGSQLSGSAIPGPFTSTHSTGAITVKFMSDPALNMAGWKATFDCSLLAVGENTAAASVHISAVRNGVFQLSSASPILTYKVYDASGKHIRNAEKLNKNVEEIDLATAPRGTYVVVVTTKNETVTKKIVR